MRNRTVNRMLALGCIAGPVLFTAAWFVLGFLNSGYEIDGDRVGPYDPVAQPISGLGMGGTGPYMNAAFILGGLLTVIGVIGVYGVIVADDPAHRRSTAGVVAALLALSGVGLILAGVFTIEQTLPHLIGFLLVAGIPVVAFPIAGRYLRAIPRWRRFGTWLVVGGPLTLLLLVVYMVSFDQERAGANEGVAGVTSRLIGIGVHAFYIALGVLAARGTPQRIQHPESNGSGTG